MFCNSVLLGYLTEYLNNPNEIPQYMAYIYAFGITALAYATIAINNYTFHIGWMVSIRVKVILTGAIYQKVCHLKRPLAKFSF